MITGIILSSAVEKYLHSYNNMTVYCFSAFRQIKKDLIMIITKNINVNNCDIAKVLLLLRE